MDYPVSMYQVTQSGRILKMDDAFNFSTLVAALFERHGYEVPNWQELTVEQFEQHVKLLKEKVG